MARYKIGIFSKKEGRVIDLDSIVKLKDLESLDKFTTTFEDETQFKIYLLNLGLINNEELNKNLNVMYKYNGKVKKIKVFYDDMKKYLDFEYLRHELKKLSGNVEFLEKLANFYHNGSTKFNKQGTNVNDIRIYLSDVRRNGGETFNPEILQMLEVAIDDLFRKAVFTLPDPKTGEVKDDYRGLRDLAYFIYKFEKLQEEILEKTQDVTKLLNKKSEYIWVQSSLFDSDYSKSNIPEVEQLEREEDLDNYDEPDFPPNSEEEANYINYLYGLETPISYDIEERSPHIR